MERDVLAKARDNARADLAKAKSIAGGYAVLPHKGVHGTWQRPVMIECRDGQAILQPKGIPFDMMDMSAMGMLRGSPFLGAIARELVKVQQATSPDGDPVVPYIYFIVRPDGVRPYYEARSRLEPLGVAFGYELVDQDWKIEFPDFDELQNWDGFTPLRPLDYASSSATASSTKPGTVSGGAFVWPVDRKTSANSGGKGAGSGGATREGHQDFVWPTHPPGEATGTENAGPQGQGELQSPANGAPAQGSRPGTGGIGSGTEIQRGQRALGSGSVDFGPLREPIPGREIGRTTPRSGAPGSPNGFDRRSREVPGSTEPGLQALDPERLPGFDPADDTRRPSGRNATASGRGDGRAGSGNPGRGGSVRAKPIDLEFPTPGDGPGTVDGININPNLSGVRRPPSGRVRIDPALLAYVDEAQELLDRMHNREGGKGGLGGEEQGGEPSGGGSGTGSNGGRKPDGAGKTEGGSPGESGNSAASPPSGIGRPSSNGGNSGMLGLGTPSFGGQPATQQGSGASGTGANASGDSHPKSSVVPQARPGFPPLRSSTIEVPLPLVVACSPEGVTIHPGGYRLTLNGLKNDGVLTRDLQAIVRNHALTDPDIHPKPRIEFLIEPGGSETYVEARKQTILSGISWPVSFRVAETSAPRVFSKERF